MTNKYRYVGISFSYKFKIFRREKITYAYCPLNEIDISLLLLLKQNMSHK